MTRQRRLLVVCYFYPPLAGGGVHRVLGFTRHLPRFGWSTTVVCASAEDYWVTDATLVGQVPAETEVIRVGGGSALSAWLRWARGRSPGADRGRRPGAAFAQLRRWSDWWLFPDSYVGWAQRARAAVSARLGAGGIDAVLSSSPPDSAHLGALAPVRRFGLPWVADFRDPWIGLHFRQPPTGWHRARHRALEARVLASADLVTAASRTHAGELLERGARRHDGRAVAVEHLPNGYEPAADVAAAGGGAAGDFFTLVFTGTLALMPDAGVLLDALHDVLARNPDGRRRLRVRIAGPYETGHEDRSVALGLKGIVEFLGPRPHAETRALQRGADLLLLWKPRGEGYRTMVPGKLYEYLDAGRPVLGILEAGEEAAELVRRAGGDLVPPGDRAAIAAAIERRYRAWRAGERGAAHRPEWLAEHTRERLAGRLAALLDGLVAGRA